MKIETIKKGHLKRTVIIGVVAVLIISAIVLNFTRAKYRVTESIPLVNGTINYSLADLNVVALYIDGVEAEELDSNTTYTLDTTNSTCTYKDGTTIGNLTLNYDSDTGAFSITPYTTKETKCTLYFDEYNPYTGRDYILSHYDTILTRNDFSTTVTNTTTGTIYKSLDETQYDNDGEVYYFAGNPTDNWVRFGGFYWRIIRINGNGSIRMIYQGTSANTNGEGTQIGTSLFNDSDSDNAYVGYMYGTVGSSNYETTHSNINNSRVKEVIDQWYQINLLDYTNYIDINAGFCNDRYPSTSNTSSNGLGGAGTNKTYYAPYFRVQINKTPSFKCTNNNDLFTASGASNGNKALLYSIGLITADETVYSGGVYYVENSDYYLYTGQNYWTISPHSALSAGMYYVGFTGFLNWTIYNSGIRPVINLRGDLELVGSGTATDPYIVS